MVSSSSSVLSWSMRRATGTTTTFFETEEKKAMNDEALKADLSAVDAAMKQGKPGWDVAARHRDEADKARKRVTELEQACEIAYVLLNYTGRTINYTDATPEQHRSMKARWEGAEEILRAVLGKSKP